MKENMNYDIYSGKVTERHLDPRYDTGPSECKNKPITG
jgi:hypothetical protein